MFRIYSVLLLFSALNIFSQKKFVLGKDVFGIRSFIENKGQFNHAVNNTGTVKFAYESSDEHVYFTEKGPVYKLIKRFGLKEKEREKIERGKPVTIKPDECYYVSVKWIGANDNIQLIESEKQNNYFTYGGSELNSYTYKKITYKNVYDYIDFEYVMSDDQPHGIKYNIVLHPGANPENIKIAYSGDVKKIIKRKGQVLVKTPLEDITEHAPLCFYDNQEKIECDFKLDNNVISFSFPDQIDKNRTIIIDPWVTTITSLLPDNYGFDVDYDGDGNLFVYGGINQSKVAKYDPAGNLIWTFSGVIPSISWTSQGVGNQYIGNFLVDKITGKIYLGQGYEPASGSRVVRLDALGNYDNFVSPVLFTVEIWDFGFHCPTATVYELGGATITNLSAGIVNPVTANVTTANFTGIPTSGQDVLSGAIDNQGNVFVIFSSVGTGAVDNRILRINNSFNGNVWMQPSTYTTFTEAENKDEYQGGVFLSNGFNCLAVNDNYLFYYDGFNIAAYNKVTGLKIGFTAVPVHAPMQQGGIAVDDCNNIYIGGIDQILSYNFNGVNFTSLPGISLVSPSVNKYVFDIKLYNNTKQLYVSGSGFTGIYSAINSLTCGAGSPFNVNVNCLGFNSSQAVATFTGGVANPTISYIWSNGGGTVAATMSTTSTSNSINLPNGTYTLQTQINSPCGSAYVNTVNIQCCLNVSVNPSITQLSCNNPVNSATIAVSGGGTFIPTYTWMPPPGAIGPGSITASALPVGINSITVNNGFGCVSNVTLNVLPLPPPITFTINNLTGSNSITCTNPTVNLQVVSNYTYGTLTYSWTSLSFTANTSTVSLNTPNTLTVTATDLATGCFVTQTISIGINTISPTNTVNPVSQVITCNSGVPVTFTATAISPTVNVQHDWYSPLNPLPNGVPIASSNNSVGVLSGNIPPGIYTLQTTNLINGCKSSKTVTITSLNSWPTYSVSSTTNFSVGCSPLNQTTLSIINPISTQTPPATCSYTFLAPSFTGVVTPSVILGANTSTTTTLPGTWTLIVQDNSNFCRTELSVPIIQNTIAPHVSASLMTQTLTCKYPTVLATGNSTTANTNINWQVPSTPPLLSTSTVEIGIPANGPNTSTTSLSYANYTVIATNSVNACTSSSVIVINQNFKPPVSSPTISIATPTAIYCNASEAPVVLTAGTSTTNSGGGALAFPVVILWQGPSPQSTVTGASSYSAYTAGIYSLTIADNYNGCESTGTVNVLDKTQPPVITESLSSAVIDCGADQTELIINITGSNANLRYWFYNYPVGTSFSPTNAIVTNNTNPLLSGTSASSVNVSKLGLYEFFVTNTLTACKAYGMYEVRRGNLLADFIADPIRGYAPLLVNFTNNSSTSTGNNIVTSIWSFGNGVTQTSGNNSSVNNVYEAPGNYTVAMISSLGTCIDTAYKTISVEIPSKLQVPNIFTPNNDGVNDVFFLKTSNIGEITSVIFDRWGNKVYDVTSSTGNIAWDGKNLSGNDCPVGVYFYVISGKGNDDKDYQVKGNVSLYR